jgi:hypothetical protein
MAPVAPHTEVADQEPVDDRNGWAGWARELGPVAATRGRAARRAALPYDHDAVERALLRWPRVRSCTPGAEDTRIERMRARHRLSNLLLRYDRRLPTTIWARPAAAGCHSTRQAQYGQ